MERKQRQEKLLTMLKSSHEFKRTEDLAEALQISRRTVFNDIIDFENNGYVFEKKPGLGLRLNSIPQKLENDKNLWPISSRRSEEVKTLLIQGKTVTIQSLAEENMVAESSIIADFTWIRETILDDSTASLVGNEKGTYISGSELQWQKALIALNNYIIQTNNFSFDSPKLIEKFSEYYSTDVVQECNNMLRSLKDFNLYYVADYYALNMLNALIVLCYRIQNGHHHEIYKSSLVYDEANSLMYYLLAKDLLHNISIKLPLEFTEEDIRYLAIYLDVNRINFEVTKPKIDPIYEQLTKKMILQVSEAVGIDLNTDKVLFQNLYLHVAPMISRLKNNISIKNPMLDEIKKQYKVMFDLTWLITGSISTALDVTLTEDEIGFLTLHFLSALERHEKSHRVLVLCPNGTVASSIIASQIRRILPPLDIVEATSKEEIKHINLEDIDLIVSTFPLDQDKVPCVVVSNIITQSDLTNIEAVYRKKLAFPKRNSVKNTGVLEKYLKRKNIYISDDDDISQAQILKKLSDSFCNGGYVTKEYYSSLIEREKNGGTDI
ncbi:MAG: transcription antiterminator, partial [Erysipelotrichaceae bacterium]|nr:transcription antiterminator [Erysipelotrichaceae bacterium]